MSALYISEQGAVLRRIGERLVVTKDKEVLEDVPIIHVDQVVVMGNVRYVGGDDGRLVLVSQADHTRRAVVAKDPGVPTYLQRIIPPRQPTAESLP